MKTGIIFNNFSVSKDREYLWDVFFDTISHYRKNLTDARFLCCGSGVVPENHELDGVFMQSKNAVESYHNNPLLMGRAIERCVELECDKIMFINPYYRINNFSFLNNKISLLSDYGLYPQDIIKSKQISFNFLYVSSDFIKRAWSKHPWNYNLQDPSENLFKKINNITSARKILNEGTFLSKKDLAVQELRVFWKSNIKYTQH